MGGGGLSPSMPRPGEHHPGFQYHPGSQKIPSGFTGYDISIRSPKIKFNCANQTTIDYRFDCRNTRVFSRTGILPPLVDDRGHLRTTRAGRQGSLVLIVTVVWKGYKQQDRRFETSNHV